MQHAPVTSVGSTFQNPNRLYVPISPVSFASGIFVTIVTAPARRGR
jgi:hypothetical protein